MNPLLTLTLLLTTLSPVLALDCASSPDRTSGNGWRYRMIDSRQCWYRHETALPKSHLNWAAPVDSELPIIQEDIQPNEPLTPVPVRTVSYRVVAHPQEHVNRQTIALLLGGVAIGLLLAGMVGFGVRGRAQNNGVNK